MYSLTLTCRDTLNYETYMKRQQEPGTCEMIGYEFYCEELFVVKHK